MKDETLAEQYDISDYHRLQYLGDDVHDILSIVLKNMTAGVGLFEVGETVRAIYLNEAYFTCVGYTREQYRKSVDNIFSTLLKEDAEKFRSCISEHAPKGEEIFCTFRGYKADGSLDWFEIHGVALENKINNNPVYLTVVKNITEKKKFEENVIALKEANAKLLIEEERYKILEATAQGLLFEYYPDRDTMVFSYNFPGNKKRREIKYYSEYIKRSPLVHSSHLPKFRKALMDACQAETEGTLEYLSAISGGGYRWHRTYYKSIADADGKILNVIGRIEDIHEAKMEQDNLNYQAERDGLTNLYRKEAAFRKMQEYVEEAPEGLFYFVILDLDDFKQINDKYGHQYGDGVLRDVAQKLTELFEELSILGRFGGDEFMILTRNIDYGTIEEMLNRLKKDYHFCAGVVTWKTGQKIEEVFDRADHAMYKIKMANKNGIYFCD